MSQLITTREALRALYDPVRERSAKKEIPELDAHASRLIGLAPFLVMASANACGETDASPRGGVPGFVKVLDPRTLLVPDSPGNNRLDTLENIVSHGEQGAPVGLLFLIPGLDETLRVNGRAWLSADEALRQAAAEPRRLPKLVIRMQVHSCYLHCAKSLMRARLWDTSAQIDRASLPSMTEMMRDQIRQFRGEEVAAETQAEVVARNRQML